MPINVGKLRRLLKSKHLYIERNIDAVISVIRRSMQNAAAFEPVVQSLKEWRHGTVRYISMFNVITSPFGFLFVYVLTQIASVLAFLSWGCFSNYWRKSIFVIKNMYYFNCKISVGSMCLVKEQLALIMYDVCLIELIRS